MMERQCVLGRKARFQGARHKTRRARHLSAEAGRYHSIHRADADFHPAIRAHQTSGKLAKGFAG